MKSLQILLCVANYTKFETAESLLPAAFGAGVGDMDVAKLGNK